VVSAQEKPVLVYERRESYSRSISWSLENLKVPHAVVEDENAFAATVARENWFYVFAGYNLYKDIQPVFSGMEQQPKLGLMVERGTEAQLNNARFISIPVQTLSIANVLNDVSDSRSCFDGGSIAEVKFSAPTARILVVDDINTNLLVAEGLMAPYGMIIDSCLSGAESIEFVKRRSYDIVFMDHMRPEMDGIETTIAIRALGEEYQKLPIIALTANALSGVKEMFLSKGFSDYLAKPIEISKLDAILVKWIKREKWEKPIVVYKGKGSESSSLVIPGLNVERGIRMTGGEENYRNVLVSFYRDTRKRLDQLRKGVDTPSVYATELDIKQFTIIVHALKSSAAIIGATAESEIAAQLENAGRAEERRSIQEELPGFCDRLEELTEHIRVALDMSEEELEEDAVTVTEADLTLQPLFLKLQDALEKQTIEDIDRIIGELEQEGQNPDMLKMTRALSDLVLIGNFKEAAEKIGVLLKEFDAFQPD
jgi:CheY-like chemotaxis protein